MPSRCASSERDAILPGSNVRWRFQVAQSRETIDDQIRDLRSTLIWSFAALGVGLLVLAALQTFYGLWPLRRVRSEVAAIRSGEKTRISDEFPTEITPLAEEINQLLAHSEAQAEEARRHAGNLAHALKTPLTVITNAATANAPDLAETVCREASVMRRQVDHHLARARAIGRRASAQARAKVWESLEAVAARGRPALRGRHRRHRRRPSGAGPRRAAGPRRDARQPRRECRQIWRRPRVRDRRAQGGRWSTSWSRTTGRASPSERRGELFTRGARLDTTGKPGTGLGLAIVRDVAEIYGGSVAPRGKRGPRRPARAPEPARGLSRRRLSSKSALRGGAPSLGSAQIDSGRGVFLCVSVTCCLPALLACACRAIALLRLRDTAPGALRRADMDTHGQARRRLLRLCRRAPGCANHPIPADKTGAGYNYELPDEIEQQVRKMVEDVDRATDLADRAEDRRRLRRLDGRGRDRGPRPGAAEALARPDRRGLEPRRNWSS